jgi:RND family efflux transporter MFP subunit
MLSVSGEVKSAEETNLAFESTGKIAAVNVKVGDKVRSGQQLAILDQTDYSDQVNQALANLDIAQDGLVRAEADLKIEKEKKEELANTHASKYAVDVQRAQIKSAQAEVDIQKAEIVSAQAALRSARDQHQKIVLQSPIDGVVTAKNIEVGETAGPTMAAIAVINEKNFKVEADISQIDVPDVKAGQSAEISFDSCPAGEKKELPVVSVDPSSTEENGSPVYTANFELGGNFSECVKPGSVANVKINVAERKNVLVLPESSLIKRGSQYFVIIQNEKGEIKEIEIEKGITGSNGMAEIISGVSEGEKVLKL